VGGIAQEEEVAERPLVEASRWVVCVRGMGMMVVWGKEEVGCSDLLLYATDRRSEAGKLSVGLVHNEILPGSG
jgi:hypothetical protein